MSTPSPSPNKKVWTSRMGNLARRASTLIPVRPNTPDKERTSSEREDDTSSLRRIGRSRSNTSISAIQPSVPSSPAPQPSQLNSQPSPIPESPAREAAASQEEVPPPAAVKSPLSHEVNLPGDVPLVVGSPAEYVPPPLIDNTAAGPGAFTDDLDELPQPSDPIADPFAPAARPVEGPQPVAAGAAENLPLRSASPEPILPQPEQSPPPVAQNTLVVAPAVERGSSAATQATQQTEPAEPPVIPTIDISDEVPAPQPAIMPEPQVPLTRSEPVPIPQPRPDHPFFGHFNESPEEEAPISMPVPSPGQASTVPNTPPPQTQRNLYVEENAGWKGSNQPSVETPMSMPVPEAPPSIDSDDSSVNIPANRSLENPFDKPVTPQHNGNGYLQPSSRQTPSVAATASTTPAAVAMPVALRAGNSKPASNNNDKYRSFQRGYDSSSDSDESQPLIRKGQKAASTSYTFNPTAPIPGRNTFDQYAAATPPRLRDRGWVEIHLPDSSVYYINQGEHIIADVELRNDRLLESVVQHLTLEQHKDSMDNAPDGSELWLRDAGNTKRGFVPVRWWVNHIERSVIFDKAFDVAVKRKLRKKKEEEDQLDLEYRYWAFVEAHPSHVVLQPKAKQEAYEAINWAMTERLLPSQSPIPPPFTQEECETLLDLLGRLDSDQARPNLQVDSAIQTRTVARILIRVAQWRQEHFRPSKPLPKDVTAKTPKPTYRRPFPRVILDFTISCLCLGIPYFFIDRSRDRRIDEESGLRSAAPMLVIGACTCIMASIVLSASVTFLSLSGLESVTRIAGFVALISAIFSMASTLFAIFSIKSDLERPPQVIGGEGLLMLSKRSVIMSLPVVFLVYSIIGFVTGVALYSLRGVSLTDASLAKRPFNEYTRWTAAGALGAFAGMVTVTVLLSKR